MSRSAPFRLNAAWKIWWRGITTRVAKGSAQSIVPQRPVLAQRPPRQVAGGPLQCPLVTRRRQPRPAHVVRQREASVATHSGAAHGAA